MTESDWLEHICQDGLQARNENPDDENPLGYGSAVDRIEREPRGQWWAISVMAEYASPIKFCPYCGIRLEAK